tara:strand:+ start:403 stop:546 length:144 start_codon:yes stop_codon:yes gene_type:complete
VVVLITLLVEVLVLLLLDFHNQMVMEFMVEDQMLVLLRSKDRILIQP